MWHLLFFFFFIKNRPFQAHFSEKTALNQETSPAAAVFRTQNVAFNICQVNIKPHFEYVWHLEDKA